jgi:hypothetical protein
MRSTVYLIVFGLATIFGCKQRQRELSDPKQKVGFDSIVPIDEVEDCVFDTNSYRFTSTALKKIYPNKDIMWDGKNNIATLPLENFDTLTLSIGGCYHFGYTATYHTKGEKFTDSLYLINQTKWLVENFFDGQIKDGYLNAFNNNDFFPYEDQELDFKPYGVRNTGVTSNHILEGFFFETSNNRTMIHISGYIN